MVPPTLFSITNLNSDHLGRKCSWVFPKIMVPPNHPLKNRDYHYFHRPFWGGFPTPILGNIQVPLIGNPHNGYINPNYWVDDHPLLYGNNGSLDPSTWKPVNHHLCFLDANKASARVFSTMATFALGGSA